jgi:hypothetical protein
MSAETAGQVEQATMYEESGFVVEPTPDGLKLYKPGTLPGNPNDVDALELSEDPAGEAVSLHIHFNDSRRPYAMTERFSVGAGRSSGPINGPHKAIISRNLATKADQGVPLSKQLQAHQFEPVAQVSEGIMAYRWRQPEPKSGETPLELLAALATTPDGEHLQRLLRPMDSEIGELVAGSEIIGGGYRGDLQDDFSRYSTGPYLNLSDGAIHYKLFSDGAAVVRDVEQVSHLTPEYLGVKPWEQKKESTGFIIGGVNKTELIKRLPSLTGIPIEQLGQDLRPGKYSSKGSVAGFLGPEDDLLSTMAADNDTVLGAGLTHQEVAEPLRLINAMLAKQIGLNEAVYIAGERYRVKITVPAMSPQQSPFNDSFSGRNNYIVTNVRTGQSVHTCELAANLIGAYGFYEGKGTSYRTSPEAIIKTFSHLQKEAAEQLAA